MGFEMVLGHPCQLVMLIIMTVQMFTNSAFYDILLTKSCISISPLPYSYRTSFSFYERSHQLRSTDFQVSFFFFFSNGVELTLGNT